MRRARQLPAAPSPKSAPSREPEILGGPNPVPGVKMGWAELSHPNLLLLMAGRAPRAGPALCIPVLRASPGIDASSGSSSRDALVLLSSVLLRESPQSQVLAGIIPFFQVFFPQRREKGSSHSLELSHFSRGFLLKKGERIIPSHPLE